MPVTAVDLDPILAQSPLWRLGNIAAITPFQQGKSNHSYRLTIETDHYVLRINSPKSEQQGAVREWESLALNAIQGKPYAPDIVYLCPSHHYQIYRYIEGESWAERPPTSQQLAELDKIIRDYQQLPLSTPIIDYQRYLTGHYNSLTSSLPPELQARWQASQPRLAELTPGHYPAALCHHDLNPSNIISGSEGITLIDWEFARFGHPDIDRYALNPQQCDNPAIAEALYWLETLWNLKNQSITG